jgi:bile acid-coenzyme A ligase
VFTVGGRNVYPAEIEAALGAHPDVLSCLVVGVPDDDLGQVPYALVRTVEFVERPLRDEAGKARRSAVRDDVIARRRAPASR